MAVSTWSLVGVVVVMAGILIVAGSHRELRTVRALGLVAAVIAIVLLFAVDQSAALVACAATAVTAAIAAYHMMNIARSREAGRARSKEEFARFAKSNPREAAEGRHPWMSDAGWRTLQRAEGRESKTP
jgi:hypothetical protein